MSITTVTVILRNPTASLSASSGPHDVRQESLIGHKWNMEVIGNQRPTKAKSIRLGDETTQTLDKIITTNQLAGWLFR